MTPPKPWFRIHNTIVDNPKIQHLPDKLVRPWLNLVATANKNGGVLPSIPDTAFALRTTPAKIETFLATFQELRLFDQTVKGWEPHDWNDWQYQSDVSTERVQRFRNKKRNGEGNVSITFNGTHQRQSRAEQNGAGALFFNGEGSGGFQPSTANGERIQWEARCKRFAESGFWLKDQWGPEPGKPGCKDPADLIAA